MKKCRMRKHSAFQTVKKASQSSPRMRRIESNFVFDRGAPQGGLSCPSGAIHLLYVGENTSQAASVRVVRQRRTRSARSRLQNTGGKARRVFSTSSNAECESILHFLYFKAISLMTSPARIRPAAPGTKATLPGICRLPRVAASSSQPVGDRASSLE